VENLSLQRVARNGNCRLFPVEFTTDNSLISRYSLNTVDVFKEFTVICPILWKYISYLFCNRYSTKQDLSWNVDRSCFLSWAKKLSDCMNLKGPLSCPYDHHRALFRARGAQSSPSHPISVRLILVLSCHLYLDPPSSHSRWDIPTKTHRHGSCYIHFHIIAIIFNKQQQLWDSY
jgi:hypothetical protein